MRIDDFVCLGRTVPEASAKYGVKVCMAGYSQELNSLIRVYPLEVRNPLRCCSTSALEVVRNANDSRPESWKLGDRNGSIVDVGRQQSTAEIVRFLRPRLSESIDELNGRRLSLGVLLADGECVGSFRRRAEVTDHGQGTLFEVADADHSFGAQALDVAPYVTFHDAAGKSHSLQIREWGCYEWVRKHREDAARLWENLRLRDGRPTLLVVGNMANHRSTWLIIKTFKAESETRPGLFAFDDKAAAPKPPSFAEYLASPGWKATRQKALERDGFACRVCNSPEGLDVHHRTYERVGAEPASDLVTLCRVCHRLFHDHGRLVKPPGLAAGRLP